MSDGKPHPQLPREQFGKFKRNLYFPSALLFGVGKQNILIFFLLKLFIDLVNQIFVIL